MLGMNLIFVGIFMLFGLFNAGVELFPDIEPKIANVNIEAPSGTRIELTDHYAEIVEQEVAGVPDLKAYATSVGTPINQQNSGGSLPSHEGSITLEFVDMADRTTSTFDTLEILRERLANFTGARITVKKMEEGPPTGAPVNIEISGDDFDVLGAIAADVKDRIRNIPGLVDIIDNYDRSLPELRIIPDVDKASLQHVPA